VSEWQASLDENVSWLLIGAQRLLHGGTMLRTVYDPNPPLNILIYAPAVIISGVLHLPLWRGLFLYMAGLTASGTVLVWRLAGLIPGLDSARRQVLTASFLVSVTILYHLIWGEREQFIYLFLFPLAMVQGLMTAQIPVPRSLKYATLIPGAVAAMIKPHYLLIPAVMLAHRAWKRRSLLSPARDPDFVLLALAGLSYLAGIFMFFPDYAFTMMPEVVRFYILRRHTKEAILSTFPFDEMAIMLLLCSTLLGLGREAQGRILIPLGLSVLCLVAFVAQMKGLPYQLVPAAGFLAVTIAIVFQELASCLVQSRAGALPGIAAVIAFAYALSIFPPTYPSNNTYAELPFPQYVREHAKKGAFYVYMDNMGMVPETSLYTGLTSASRFPSLWFLPALLERDDKAVFNLYAGYIAEDFARWQPSVLLIQRKGYIHERGKNDFDFMTYFGKNPALGAELKHYKSLETQSFTTADYFGGNPLGMSDNVIFDVYVRRP
jgi:hypothetical protein